MCNQMCVTFINWQRQHGKLIRRHPPPIPRRLKIIILIFRLDLSLHSICLPMEALDPLDIAYLITVLAVNGLGFFIVVICYAQIYFSLGTETRTRSTTSGEMTVAKKMALLVG